MVSIHPYQMLGGVCDLLYGDSLNILVYVYLVYLQKDHTSDIVWDYTPPSPGIPPV